jgi:hypothetical protein
MPERFRKRPVEVEAIQWTGDNLAEVQEFTGGLFRTIVSVTDFTAQVHDKLHDTWVDLKTGQWVIRGVLGEFYPIDERVLADTYERVSVQ